ncbi:MAG: trypsin-like serine protease [Candidatus Heimdallarchaeota archaeon]|nr:trypsin-like serine protease [Candidatus Heimdallarchaeota archaeon]
MKTIQKLSVLLIGFTLLIAMITPSTSITNGDLDGEDHPHVGIMVFDVNGRPSHRCTGTLLSATVMLTAGHCTVGTSGGRVWFDSNDEAGIRADGYPFSGGNAFVSIFTHPDYIDAAFFLHDAGLVILSEPVILSTYGELPELGLFDELLSQRAYQRIIFTVVGYGLQKANSGINTQSDLVRYQATVRIINDDELFSPGSSDSILFTNNAATGGTCFGDSGGPIFFEDTNIVAAVTSFGLNSECGGTGGGYRMDVSDAQDFVNNNS